MDTKETITYDDFAKLDIRIGKIIVAERVPETDKLIKCTIDFGLKPSSQGEDGSADHSENGLGEMDLRTIVSGIAEYRDAENLVGKHLPYIVNLEPRTIKGIESEGMLVALSYGEGGFSLLVPDKSDVPTGTRIA